MSLLFILLGEDETVIAVVGISLLDTDGEVAMATRFALAIASRPAVW